MTEPLLSICIPTRNRAAFLYRTLRSITENPLFQNGNEIEVVVSDNVSTDATEEVVKIFIEKYGDKIVYSRNDENIKDKNFGKALSLGNGDFLKLNNDTFWFDGNGLERLLSKIKQYQKERPVLCFTNDGEKEDVVCKNLDEFVSVASYMTTWLGSFGIWKDDFDRIPNFSENSAHQLTQTENLFKEIVRKKEAVIIQEQYLNYQFVWNKKKNPAKIYGEYYLDILNEYVQDGSLSKRVFNKEKRLLLKTYLLTSWCSRKYEDGCFGLNDGTRKYYSHAPYFYAYLFMAYVNGMVDLLTEWWKIKRRGIDGNFRKHWRKRNRLSSVIPVKVEYPNNVYVGKGSSGELIVENCDPEKNTLIIGENVKIGKNVRFVFNGGEKLILVSDDSEIPDGTTVYSQEGALK